MVWFTAKNSQPRNTVLLILKMGERERAKEGERECAGDCNGEEGDEGSAPRRRRKECKFSVESKEFERRDAEGRNANLAWNQRSLRLLGTRGKENSKSSLWRRREGLSHGFGWVRTV